MTNFNFKIVATLLLIFGTSSAFAEGKACHALFVQVRPTEEQIDIAVLELHGLRTQMYSSSLKELPLIKKTFDQKFDELSTYVPATEIRLKMRAIEAKKSTEIKAEKVEHSRTVGDWIMLVEEAKLFLHENNFTDIKSANRDNDSPLALALWKGKYHLIEPLLSLGANPNERGNLMRGHHPPFLKSVMNGEIKIIETFIKAGANVNMTGKDSETALTLAVERPDTDITKLLLKHNADVHFKNEDNGGALKRAIYFGNFDQISLLLESGLNLNTERNSPHLFPLTLGSERTIPILEFLLKKGANPNIQNIKEGKTALIYLQEYEIRTIRSSNMIGIEIKARLNYKAMEILLENGADPNIKDVNGNTALSILLKNTPDPEAQINWNEYSTKTGTTISNTSKAKDMPFYEYHFKKIELLKKYGARE